jgi:organic hydroperoxide reductase OsmC/OhrA
MATVRARRFEYGVTMDRSWTVASDRGGARLERDEAWTPEHLVLAGLCRCVLTALDFHAKRAGVEAESSARAEGIVTRRESDGRFAFVEIAVEADVALVPAPDEDAVRQLVELAERDCFVSASLAVAPSYRWTVNGAPLA